MTPSTTDTPAPNPRSWLLLPSCLALATLLASAGSADAQLAPGTIVATNNLTSSVLTIDPVTGAATVISGGDGMGGTIGSGPDLTTRVGSIAIDAAGNLLVLDTLDSSGDAILSIDPVTGDRTIVSDASTGAGTPFTSPVDILVDATGRILVSDLALSTIFSVDPATGDRGFVSGNGVSDSGFRPTTIVSDASGDLFVADNSFGGITAVDPSTGARSVVSSDTVGSGLSFDGGDPPGLAFDASGALFAISDNSSNPAVIAVDPITGDRTIISDATTGSGPGFFFFGDIEVDASGELLVYDVGFANLLSVDPVTGDRTLIYSVPGGGGGAGLSDIFVVPAPVVPEPSAAALLVTAAVGLLHRRR